MTQTVLVSLMLLAASAMAAGPAALDIPEFYRERIDANRKSDLTVRVLDSEGKPAAGVVVRAEMQRHAFMFGTAVAVSKIVDPAQQRYRETVTSLFNAVVFENRHKWKYWERLAWRPRSDEALRWVLDNGLRLRGHALLWQTLKYGCPMPKDVEATVRGGNEADRQMLRRRVGEHIASQARHFAGLAEHWDVVNEQVTEHAVTEFLTPDRVQDSPDLVEWFQAARRADPRARLYINDFHILVGDKKGHKNLYEKVIRHLLDNGAPLEGIGLQCHFYNYGLTRTREQLWQTLERFGSLGPKLCVTEFDTFGKGWGETPAARDQAKAEYLHRVLTTFFAHPKAEGFMVWGFWDGAHWAKDAPFYRADWSEKPALAVYKDLVFGQWWSDETGQSDEAGACRFRLFNGDYKVTLTRGEATFTIDAKVAPDNGELVVTLP